ncbi:MAG: amino-acid N-acetyltransferase [Microbacteriaceae bacterium]
MSGVSIRRAKTQDVRRIIELIDPLVQERVLLGKDPVIFYEAVQEFRVAEDADGNLIGCGALHVMWEDLGEIRTIAVSKKWRGTGVGHLLLEHLVQDALELGLSRLFCLTFEVDFFARQGFESIDKILLKPSVEKQLLRSPDEGVAEFLELERVKPNTLGNTRMLLHLDDRKA